MRIMPVICLRHSDIDEDQFKALLDQRADPLALRPTGKGAAVMAPVRAQHDQDIALVFRRAGKRRIHRFAGIDRSIVKPRFGIVVLFLLMRISVFGSLACGIDSLAHNLARACQSFYLRRGRGQ